MKRSDVVVKLIKEGFTEKTLSRFSDKQIFSLAERILKEAEEKTETKRTVNYNISGTDVEGVKKLLPSKRSDGAEIKVNNTPVPEKTAATPKEMGEAKKKLSDKQSKTMDTDKDGDIDSIDLKNLRSKKKVKSDVKEEKKWIQKAVHPSKKGSLKKALGVKKDEKIPMDKLKSAAKKGGKLGQRARFAMNVRGLKENNSINNWLIKLVENEYHPLTSKGEIMELINVKLRESEKETKKAMPDFMKYDSIKKNKGDAMEQAVAPTREKPKVDPGKKGDPGKKSDPSKKDNPGKKSPYEPGPGKNPSPKAGSTIKVK